MVYKDDVSVSVIQLTNKGISMTQNKLKNMSDVMVLANHCPVCHQKMHLSAEVEHIYDCVHSDFPPRSKLKVQSLYNTIVIDIENNRVIEVQQNNGWGTYGGAATQQLQQIYNPTITYTYPSTYTSTVQQLSYTTQQLYTSFGTSGSNNTATIGGSYYFPYGGTTGTTQTNMGYYYPNQYGSSMEYFPSATLAMHCPCNYWCNMDLYFENAKISNIALNSEGYKIMEKDSIFDIHNSMLTNLTTFYETKSFNHITNLQFPLIDLNYEDPQETLKHIRMLITFS